MSKLSKREILLLFILGFMVVGGGTFALWILPLQQDIAALESQNSDLKIERMRVQSLVASLEKLRESEKTMLTETDTALKNLLAVNGNEGMDIFFGVQFAKAGFTLQSLTYSLPEAVVPTTTETQENTAHYSLKELIDAYIDIKKDQESETPTTTAELLKVEITSVIKGDESKVAELLDALSSNGKNLYVKGISYVENKTSTEITLVMDYYFVEKD